MKTFHLEVEVIVDDDECETENDELIKEIEIRRAIENISPHVGIFTVDFV